MPIRRALIFAVAATVLRVATCFADAPAPDNPESAAVVFVYGRIGDDETTGGLRTDQFEAHLEELTDDAYTVMPLGDIMAAIRNGKPLPDRAVALTFDDATRSFYDTAWPRLRDAGYPFTLFVATDAVDRGAPDHMTWTEVKEIAAAPGATIGALGATTNSLATRSVDDARAELARMESRFTAMLGKRPRLFAYPQGEYTSDLQGEIEKRDYDAAFGLQSGVLYPGADRLALPRFIMIEPYGGIERFRIAANALPLPVTDVTPEDPIIDDDENPPPIGFTVDPSIGDLSKLACFSSSQGRTGLERISDSRIEVRISQPFPPGRSRINCTLPTADGRWRWFGLQFVVPH